MDHRIKAGQTLSGIAAKYKTSVSALMKANPQIKDANFIQADKTLNVPGTSDGFDDMSTKNPGGAKSKTDGTGGSRSGDGDSFTPAAAKGDKSGPVRDNDGRKFPTSEDGTPLYRQGDKAWGSRTLGSSSSLAAAGCAMTATAMAISKISGKVINPGELDKYLDKHGGYAGNGLKWDVAAKAAGLSARTQPWSLSTINKQLDAGRPVVVGVDYKAGGNGGGNGTDHWITITGRGKQNGKPVYYANDPATGKQITLGVDGNQLKGGPKGYKTTGELRTFSGGNPKPNKPAQTADKGDTKSSPSKSTQAGGADGAKGTERSGPVKGNNDLSGFSSNKYDSIINEMSKKYDVPARLIKAVIQAESGFNPNATSPVGAKGLMQLMPATAKGLGVKDRSDPRQSIEGGTKYLAQMLKQFKGDERLALAAYNAGPGNVNKYNGVPPFKETQAYVKKIMGWYNGPGPVAA
ncbi:transglycosylase SLT domain-containing protein [Archangium violaceum]|uniref:transglycosylase SLT domain-containing protein n=1 Tax=Archangium violaceum TaxID=83451 RepID=UPI002B2B4E8E|nr:transglycosylase SLT domain-containing protein [Archangium violaceum]